MYRKINAKASGLRENMLIYLSFLEAHSYPCIFSHQVEVIVYLESISKLTVIRVYFRTKWRLLFIYQLSWKNQVILPHRRIITFFLQEIDPFY